MFHLPVSKSIAQRILVMQAMAGVPIGMPADISVAEDVVLLQHALNKRLYNGAPTEHQRSTNGALTEHPRSTHGAHRTQTVDIGANGTAYRLLTAYFWNLSSKPQLVGSPRLMERPIEPLLDALRALDLGESDILVDNRLSSQFVTALLLVAPRYGRDLTFRLMDEKQSRSYIHLTIALMRQWGIHIEETSHSRTASQSNILVHQGHYRQPANWQSALEPDWSAAAVWFEWSVLHRPEADLQSLVTKLNLRHDSLQGDRKILDLMTILVSQSSQPILLDMHDTPDLVPYLWVTAHQLGVPVRFLGIDTLQYKESDRLAALQEALSSNSSVKSTHHDHRLAMAFAAADWQVDDRDCVCKSYPDFWADLKKQAEKFGFLQKNS